MSSSTLVLVIFDSGPESKTGPAGLQLGSFHVSGKPWAELSGILPNGGAPATRARRVQQRDMGSLPVGDAGTTVRLRLLSWGAPGTRRWGTRSVRLWLHFTLTLQLLLPLF